MIKSAKEVIVIVDAYSTGRHLPHLFLGYGYSCIHVATHLKLPSTIKNKYWYHYCYDANVFIDNFDLNDKNDITEVVQRLKNYRVLAVMLGCESGVQVADAIARYFDVQKNNYKTSHLRRHKFHMIEGLAAANLKAQTLCTISKCKNSVINILLAQRAKFDN